MTSVCSAFSFSSSLIFVNKLNYRTRTLVDGCSIAVIDDTHSCSTIPLRFFNQFDDQIFKSGFVNRLSLTSHHEC